MSVRTDPKQDRRGGFAAPGTWVWWPRRMLELVVFGPREMLWVLDDAPAPRPSGVV